MRPDKALQQLFDPQTTRLSNLTLRVPHPLQPGFGCKGWEQECSHKLLWRLAQVHQGGPDKPFPARLGMGLSCRTKESSKIVL